MSDLGGLAARGVQRQMMQPTFAPQTSMGLMAGVDGLFHRLAQQLRQAERDARAAAADKGGPVEDDVTRGQRLKEMADEVTVVLGHKIPSKDMAIFNQMVQDGYTASVSLLLDIVEAGRLDDMVYQAFRNRRRHSEDGRITLDRGADGSEQWQIRGARPDGHDARPLEKRRYEPRDRAAFEQILAELR
jgi:hypothetical protein